MRHCYCWNLIDVCLLCERDENKFRLIILKSCVVGQIAMGLASFCEFLPWFDLLCQVTISVLEVFIRLQVWEGVACFCKCGKVCLLFGLDSVPPQNLSNLSDAYDFLQGLEMDVTQPPDLYKYIVEDANIPSSRLCGVCVWWGHCHRR